MPTDPTFSNLSRPRRFTWPAVPDSPIVPRLVLLVVLCTCCYLPLDILGRGYLPKDDALSHAAKAVSGKEWSEILVLAPRVVQDSHPGWHFLLRGLHLLTGWGVRPLVMAEVLCLFLCVTLVPLLFLRRPEVWLATLFVVYSCDPRHFYRLLLGRPLLFTMTVLLLLCFAWTYRSDLLRKRSWAMFLLVAMVLAAWLHGAWQLFLIPLCCCLAARAFRAAGFLALGLAVQTVGAALLSGNPLTFVGHVFTRTLHALGDFPLQRMLVDELQGVEGFPLVLGLVALVLVWQRPKPQNLLCDPVFVLLASCYVLAAYSVRFWIDWGLPALACFLAPRFEEAALRHQGDQAWSRLVTVACLAATLIVSVTSDVGGRWSEAETRDALSSSKPSHATWLPEPGGILYASEAEVFFSTFAANPHAPWRYALGIEATMMAPEDFEVLKTIRLNRGSVQAHRPWAAKLRPEDRLVLLRPYGTPPALPELEWSYLARNTWVGRTPRGSANGGN
ncbi:MAG: hypothetical protein A2284_04285 [Deltaproteobacteria bacterium RIFOXYA12_FULL_61_11]|nr:MAG: hypothetical protein A2284_04285 [Deltaproteobacteria bacterium RIFOXYA12_FULL_61_11]